MKKINKFILSIDALANGFNNWFCRNFEWFFTNGVKAEYDKNWYRKVE